MRHSTLLFVLVLLLLTHSAMAVKVADITRMNGARTNVLTGMGLVVGDTANLHIPARKSTTMLAMDLETAGRR